MFKPTALLALLSLVPALVDAASPLYGQCGGINWSESPSCFVSIGINGCRCFAQPEKQHVFQGLPAQKSMIITSSACKQRLL